MEDPGGGLAAEKNEGRQEERKIQKAYNPSGGKKKRMDRQKLTKSKKVILTSGRGGTHTNAEKRREKRKQKMKKKKEEK